MSSTGILVISWNFPPRVGGLENLIAGLCCGLKKNHSLVVITSWASGAADRDERVLRPRWPGLPGFFIFAMFRGFLVLRRNPEIKWILGGSALVCPLVLVLARLLRRKSIILVHGLDVIYPRRVYQALCVRVLRFCDRIVPNSRYTLSLAEEKGISRERLVVIPPGIDDGPRPSQGAEEVKAEFGVTRKKVLLYVGRLARRKGLKEFLQNSFPRIVAEVPEVCFLIVGGNPTESLVHHEDVAGELKGQIRAMKMQDRIRLLGWLGDDDLAKVYRASDLLVLPALAMKNDVEGFGIVVIEAAAAGLPAVATRVGGIPDAIEDGMSGILVDADAYEDMTRTIVNLLHDGEKRRILSDYARKRAAEKFSWERIAKQYDAVFEAVGSTAPSDIEKR